MIKHNILWQVIPKGMDKTPKLPPLSIDLAIMPPIRDRIKLAKKVPFCLVVAVVVVVLNLCNIFIFTFDFTLSSSFHLFFDIVCYQYHWPTTNQLLPCVFFTSIIDLYSIFRGLETFERTKLDEANSWGSRSSTGTTHTHTCTHYHFPILHSACALLHPYPLLLSFIPTIVLSHLSFPASPYFSYLMCVYVYVCVCLVYYIKGRVHGRRERE